MRNASYFDAGNIICWCLIRLSRRSLEKILLQLHFLQQQETHLTSCDKDSIVRMMTYNNQLDDRNKSLILKCHEMVSHEMNEITYDIF